MSEYSQIMDARDYLINNILLPLHPNIEPLPTLLGVCTQVDNAAAEILRLRSELANAKRVGWIAGRDAAAEAAEGTFQNNAPHRYVEARDTIVVIIRAMEPPA